MIKIDLKKPPICIEPDFIDFENLDYWERPHVRDDLIDEWEYYRNYLSEYRKVYMNSEEWKSIRQQAFSRDNFRCKYCGGHAEQAHHTTYYNIGTNKELKNLESVCVSCHLSIHENKGHMPKTPYERASCKYPVWSDKKLESLFNERRKECLKIIKDEYHTQISKRVLLINNPFYRAYIPYILESEAHILCHNG
jgi:5-methylcytosine-specific restriction endonuclease McrA